MQPHLSEVEGDEWLMEVSESTCMDIMDEWDANYESWESAFKIDEVERMAMDGFVDVKPEFTKKHPHRVRYLAFC